MRDFLVFLDEHLMTRINLSHRLKFITAPFPCHDVSDKMVASYKRCLPNFSSFCSAISLQVQLIVVFLFLSTKFQRRAAIAMCSKLLHHGSVAVPTFAAVFGE